MKNNVKLLYLILYFVTQCVCFFLKSKKPEKTASSHNLQAVTSKYLAFLLDEITEKTD